VPKQVTDWCLKVKLGWEIAADGNASGCDAEQLEVYGTAEVASILNVTRRQVRNLVNDLDAQKSSGVWVFPKQAVIDYAEERVVDLDPATEQLMSMASQVLSGGELTAFMAIADASGSPATTAPSTPTR
jgi:hypothetical protein